MKQKIIHHPFRKITYDYDESKPWTPRDEKLMKTYVQLHDQEHQRHLQAKDLSTRFGEADRLIGKTRKELKRVEKQITATRNAADNIASPSATVSSAALQKFGKQVNETNNTVQRYDKNIRQLEIEIKELIRLKDIYIDEDEDYENSLWERLSELTITYAHDQRLATDYVSFDNDEEQLRDRATFMSRENDRLIDHCDRVIENYNRLLLETTVQYEVWKEFGKRLELIERIFGVSGNFPDFSSN